MLHLKCRLLSHRTITNLYNFRPTIVKNAPLLMSFIEPLTSESMTRILKKNDFNSEKFCNISTIPYAVGDEKDIQDILKSNQTRLDEL